MITKHDCLALICWIGAIKQVSCAFIDELEEKSTCHATTKELWILVHSLEVVMEQMQSATDSFSDGFEDKSLTVDELKLSLLVHMSKLIYLYDELKLNYLSVGEYIKPIRRYIANNA